MRGGIPDGNQDRQVWVGPRGELSCWQHCTDRGRHAWTLQQAVTTGAPHRPVVEVIAMLMKHFEITPEDLNRALTHTDGIALCDRCRAQTCSHEGPCQIWMAGPMHCECAWRGYEEQNV